MSFSNDCIKLNSFYYFEYLNYSLVKYLYMLKGSVKNKHVRCSSHVWNKLFLLKQEHVSSWLSVRVSCFSSVLSLISYRLRAAADSTDTKVTSYVYIQNLSVAIVIFQNSLFIRTGIYMVQTLIYYLFFDYKKKKSPYILAYYCAH